MDIVFPRTFKTSRLMAAYPNPVEDDKIEAFKRRRAVSDPPPIRGYTSTIDENDLEDMFLTGEVVTEEHIGEDVFYVTDGFHRAFAAIELGLEKIDVEPELGACDGI